MTLAPTRERKKARVDGFDLDATVAVSPRPCDRLEQLCRCILRPPFAVSRLPSMPDGRGVTPESSRVDGLATATSIGHTRTLCKASSNRLCSMMMRPSCQSFSISHRTIAEMLQVASHAPDRHPTWGSLGESESGGESEGAALPHRTRPALSTVIPRGMLRVVSELIMKTVRLPKRLAQALVRTARSRGCSESELIRAGIEAVLNDRDGLDMEALIGPDLGVGHGPSDLSSAREHLSGYGRTRRR